MITLKKEGRYWYLDINGDKYICKSLTEAMNLIERRVISADKQIEEMARIICKPTANRGECEKCGFKKQCSKFDDAKDLYKKGYRKASEVAREIINEIADLIWKGESEKMNFCVGGHYYDKQDFITELKKKYEREGEG